VTVSDLRRDPVTGRWVAVGTGIPHPHDFDRTTVVPELAPSCPLCESQEERTAPELWVERPQGAPNGPGWLTRVVPNHAPMVRVEGMLERRGDGIFDTVTGVGAHELIVESPHHHESLATLDDAGRTRVLWALRERINDLRRDVRFRHFFAFKNHGTGAGAALSHAHTQLLALPVVPREVQEEVDGARAHYAAKERCVFCDIIRQEEADGARVIATTPGFVALAPFASRSPFETWILPRAHHAHFESSSFEACWELATMLGTVLRGLNQALETPPYMLALHNAPVPDGQDFYHWHIEVVPRVTRQGSLEALAGFHLNPTRPEDAAQFLRSIADEGGSRA
jgi:UDPglucose--hexose-1-phosphate uridylyltransferase